MSSRTKGSGVITPVHVCLCLSLQIFCVSCVNFTFALFFQKDFSFLKQEFVKVYMSSVYFLLHSPSLPSHCWADPSSEEQRARVIYDTLNSLKHNQHTNSHSGGLKVFVDPSYQHIAFDVSELTFDFLSVARWHIDDISVHSGEIWNVPKHLSAWSKACDWVKSYIDSLYFLHFQYLTETET